MVAYQEMESVDYIDLVGTMTSALTSRTEPDEYKARILAMASVYWSLGIQEGDPLQPDNYKKLMRQKADWAVLSFKAVSANDADLQTAAHAAKHVFAGSYIYRFEIFRWGDQREDPANPKIALVEILEEVTAYSDGKCVIKKAGDSWALDASIPTS